MDIISYNKENIDSNIAKSISELYGLVAYRRSGFDINPTLTKYISKLSNQYNKYKETYNFPKEYEGTNYSNRSFIKL